MGVRVTTPFPTESIDRGSVRAKRTYMQNVLIDNA